MYQDDSEKIDLYGTELKRLGVWYLLTSAIEVVLLLILVPGWAAALYVINGVGWPFLLMWAILGAIPMASVFHWLIVIMPFVTGYGLYKYYSRPVVNSTI